MKGEKYVLLRHDNGHVGIVAMDRRGRPILLHPLGTSLFPSESDARVAITRYEQRLRSDDA